VKRTRGPDLLQVGPHGCARGDFARRLPQRLHLALQVGLAQGGVPGLAGRKGGRGGGRGGVSCKGTTSRRARRVQASAAAQCVARLCGNEREPHGGMPRLSRSAPTAHLLRLFAQHPLLQLLRGNVAVRLVHLRALPAVVDDHPARGRAPARQALHRVRQARGGDRGVEAAQGGECDMVQASGARSSCGGKAMQSVSMAKQWLACRRRRPPPVPAAPAKHVQVGRQLLVAQRARAARQARRRRHSRIQQRVRVAPRRQQHRVVKVVGHDGVGAAFHSQLQDGIRVVHGALPAGTAGRDERGVVSGGMLRVRGSAGVEMRHLRGVSVSVREIFAAEF
jgi:hypothetical protein